MVIMSQKATIPATNSCSLCTLGKGIDYFKDDLATYYQCAQCGLIFMSKAYHLSKNEEKRRYDFHQNDPTDPEYRAFLSTLLEPLASRLTTGANGLDYGCGPGPTVSSMLNEQGFKMKTYDPYYYNDEGLLNKTYDFITCTEVVEHLRNPAKDWQQMAMLVRNGGWIGVMTDLFDENIDFGSWYYRRDPTHICFYSKKTFMWIAGHFNFEATFPCKRTVILHSLRSVEDYFIER